MELLHEFEDPNISQEKSNSILGYKNNQIPKEKTENVLDYNECDNVSETNIENWYSQ